MKINHQTDEKIGSVFVQSQLASKNPLQSTSDSKDDAVTLQSQQDCSNQSNCFIKNLY